MSLLDLLWPNHQLRLARRCMEAGDPDGAARHLSTLDLGRLSRQRRCSALLLQARVDAALGRGDEAVSDLEAATALDPLPSRLREVSAEVHHHLSNRGLARPALRAADLGLKAGADDQTLLLCRADSLAALGRRADAAAGFRLALARDPRCVEALLGLALLAAGEPRTAADAVGLCLKALSIRPPSGDVEGVHQRLLHTLCRAWLAEGQVDTCLGYFTDMPAEVGWVRAYGLAAALVAKGEPERAVRVVLTAIWDDEDHPYLLQLLRELEGHPAETLPVWDVWVRLRWRGGQMPQIARMLPPDITRGYQVAAENLDRARDTISRVVPPVLFEEALEVVASVEREPLIGGRSGILAILSEAAPG